MTKKIKTPADKLATLILIIVYTAVIIVASMLIKVIIADNTRSYNVETYRPNACISSQNIKENIALSCLPSGFIDDFYNDGMSIHYVSKNELADWAAGYFNPDKKGIYIKKSDNDTSFLFLHELGHYFDWKSQDISQSTEWEQITKEEFINSQTSQRYIRSREKNGYENQVLSEVIKSNYFGSNGSSYVSYVQDPKEFFAEEFAYYCENNNNYESKEQDKAITESQNCPKAQAFIKELVSSYTMNHTYEKPTTVAANCAAEVEN